MSKEMIRYGRVNGRKPKNTLYTFREDGLIYFGISRCDLTTDNFERLKGSNIAKLRALKAKEELLAQNQNTKNDLIHTDDKGLRGVVGIENIKVLLEHFDKIDNYSFSQRR